MYINKGSGIQLTRYNLAGHGRHSSNQDYGLEKDIFIPELNFYDY
ncbi:unnamed protein product [marine sediment metagenome]|uniref:Uncharacterized protein n=1 Tax=marine sediment metagenome TaxID=412755 RepID=X0S054_9ZZZZ